MPIELNHKNVRDLAKNLREKVGREDIKHSEVISAIASAVGRRPDAMMHELKHEGGNAPVVRHVESPTGVDAVELAKKNGYGLWNTGGGCQAFGIKLREAETPDNDVAVLELLITTDEGCSVDAKADDPVWQVGVSYTDPRGGDSVRLSEESLTLQEAISQGMAYAQEAELLWQENYSEDDIADYACARGF